MFEERKENYTNEKLITAKCNIVIRDLATRCRLFIPVFLR